MILLTAGWDEASEVDEIKIGIGPDGQWISI